MALVEETLFGRVDKVQIAIDRLKSFAPRNGEPYWLAFSGGKDSQCIYELAKMAGVPFEAHYSVTSVDPPEVIRFMKKYYPDVIFDHHRYYGHPRYKDGTAKTMWTIISDHTIPPTRQARYCCAELKETSGKGRVVITGVRWAESAKRKERHGVAEIRTTSKKLHKEAAEGDSAIKKTKKNDSIVFLDDNSTARRMVEHCFAKKKTTVNPIVEWTEEDVWEFLNDVAKVPHCELYDEGFARLGCIACPLQGREGMIRDFERWPKYKEKYIKAFDRMIANHPGEIKVASGELAQTNVGGYSAASGLTGVFSQDDSSQIIQVERERERDGSGPQTNGGRTEKKPSDGGWRTTSDLVDVDVARPEGQGRGESDGVAPPLLHQQDSGDGMVETKRGVELRVLGQQFLDYWLWRCRANPADEQPKPTIGTLKWQTTETEKKY